jgi:hypothetical protein
MQLPIEFPLSIQSEVAAVTLCTVVEIAALDLLEEGNLLMKVELVVATASTMKAKEAAVCTYLRFQGTILLHQVAALHTKFQRVEVPQSMEADQFMILQGLI